MSDELQERILAGDDTEKYVLSAGGKGLLKLATEDIDAAVLAFSEVDLADCAKVAKIQQDLKVAMRFSSYLSDLVQRGREALTEYEQQENAKKGKS